VSREASSPYRAVSAISEWMKFPRSALGLALAFSLGAGAATAAIREPRPADPVRVLAEAKAEQPSPPPRSMQAAPAAAPAVSVDPRHDEELRREMLERGNVMDARFDALDAKIYEIVGRLQLLAGCLIALFLGLAVWQISISRQLAQLRGRQMQQSGGLR